MAECIDTIVPVPGPGPLEAVTARISAGLIHVARLIDRGLLRAVDVVFEWRARAVERDVMRALDDRMLRDVGLSRADLERELSRPFWHR